MTKEKIVILGKDEKAWADIVEVQEEALRTSKINVEISELVLKYAKKRKEEESEKFK